MSDFINGTVLRFNNIKGYGFVADDNNREIFVHYSNIVGEGYKSLETGRAVRFKMEESDRGPKAVSVELI